MYSHRLCRLAAFVYRWLGWSVGQDFSAQPISTFPPVHMAVIIPADNTGLRGSPSQGPATSPALYHATDDATDGWYALSCPSPVVATISRALTLKKGIAHQTVPFKVVWVSSPFLLPHLPLATAEIGFNA